MDGKRARRVVRAPPSRRPADPTVARRTLAPRAPTPRLTGSRLGRPGELRPDWRRLSGIRLVAIFLGFAVLFSAFWYPMWTAIQEPDWFVYLHYWLRSWI